MKSNSMKKIVVLLVFLIIVFIIIFFVIPFSLRTISTRGPIPYGVWQSEDPHITLYLAPETELFVGEPIPGTHYPGIYIKDGENINIIIGFGYSKSFSIYNEALFYSDEYWNYRDAYYNGTYRVRGNKLRYNVLPFWQEQTSIKTIVFEKVSDYEIE